jgi:FKBP-type peptidyl-prolyl cis-trans isomerase FkpA
MKRMTLLAGGILLAACNRQNSGSNVPLATRTDSVSYIVGMQMGKSLKEQSVPVTPNAILAGLNDGLAGATSKIPDDKAQVTMAAFRDEMMSRQHAKDSSAAAVNEKAGADFLAANKSKPGVMTTASGLQYKVVKQGTGPKPGPKSVVTVHYKGALLNGEAFDSSYGRDPVTFPLTGVVPGWSEGVQLMSVGSKYTIWIPGNLAWGPQGSPPKIGPDETVTFDIELVEIKKP